MSGRLSQYFARLNTVFRPKMEHLQASGRLRLEFDMPARLNRNNMAVYPLTEHEALAAWHRPKLGVDHIYSPHVGSESRPVIVDYVDARGEPAYVACSGGCAPLVPEERIYARVPQHQMVLCADCGLHFVVNATEGFTFYPDGTQPTGHVTFEEVRPMLEEANHSGVPLIA